MDTKTEHIEVSGITVKVVRKSIKNLHIGVYPPDGMVRVAAPSRMSMEAIRLALTGKLGWIKKHQTKCVAQVRQPPREFITGENHFFMGQRYELVILPHNGRPRIELRHSFIEMYLPSDSSITYREALLYHWYRQQMKKQIPELLDKWQQIIGVHIDECGIKRMKTKWGTCNIKARRIWLNLELIKKPVHCIEYIIVHELVHLLERLHNDRFKGLMDMYLPAWRQYKAELNHDSLGYDT